MVPRKLYDVPLPHGRMLRLGVQTFVMGIINVTPDSFASDGSSFNHLHAIETACAMEAEGADLLDIGGESTRPGAMPVDASEELSRIQPVLEAVIGKVKIPVSVDTYKAEVAKSAIQLGATLINDVSGLEHGPSLAEVVAEYKAGLVLAHTRGRSQAMYREATYSSLAREVGNELATSLQCALTAGVAREAIILDPGIGFAKKEAHSFAALAQLDRLQTLDRPLLVGPSRKSFMASTLGGKSPAEREWGTAAAIAAAVMMGAHIVRVHGVREMVDVVRVVDRVRSHRNSFCDNDRSLSEEATL